MFNITSQTRMNVVSHKAHIMHNIFLIADTAKTFIEPLTNGAIQYTPTTHFSKWQRKLTPHIAK